MVMRQCLSDMGVAIDADGDRWTVGGRDGALDSPERPLWVGGSGTTARFLTAVASLNLGETWLDGDQRMRLRPMSGLVAALRRQGAEIEGEALPLLVRGGGLAGGVVAVPTGETSQFASALLIVGPFARKPLEVRPEGEFPSLPYARSTVDLMRGFGAEVTEAGGGWSVAGSYEGRRLVVEGDASAAVYPWVAAAITGGRVTTRGLGAGSSQPDLAVADVLGAMGCRVEAGERSITVAGPQGRLAPVAADLSALPDGALAVAVACLFASGPSRLTGLGSLQWKESDRGRALAEELAKTGARVGFEGEVVTIEPCPLGPAVLDSRGDHRLAMAFSLLGLMVEGISVTQPECVSKTWPGFFEVLEGL
jgi:3-phosphoshikimate 1-carboxyvinyltransferase